MNALIAACGRGRRPDLSMALINEMESRFGVVPDARSYRSSIIACNQAEHMRKMLAADNSSYDDDGAQGAESADDDLLSVQWWECALSLLRRMQEDGLTPDIQTFSSVISACEAGGQWQRALNVLQSMMDADQVEAFKDSPFNLYCFNAAISACGSGGAWVEALDLYERMLEQGGSIQPNFVTLNSLIVALDQAGQKELAQSMYDDGRRLRMVNPWRRTTDSTGKQIYAMVRKKWVCV